MAVEAPPRQNELEDTQEPEYQTGFGKKRISVEGEDIEIPHTGFFYKLTDALVYQQHNWQPDRPGEKDYYHELSGRSGMAIKAGYARLVEQQKDLLQELEHDALMRNREYEARRRLADPRVSIRDRQAALQVAYPSEEELQRRDIISAVAYEYLAEKAKEIHPDFDPRELCQE